MTFSGGTVRLTDANNLTIDIGTSAVDTHLIAGGSISETDFLSVGGWTFLTAGGDINLGLSNTLVGQVQFTGANATIQNSVPTVLGDSSATSTITLSLVDSLVAAKLTATHLNISGATTINQTNAWKVTGTTSIASSGAVVVDNAANDFNSMYIAGTVIVLQDANSIVLTGATATNNINLFSGVRSPRPVPLSRAVA